MEPIEIIVIVITVLFVSSVIGNYIYRKIHHLPTGECACCQKKGNNLFKQYRKLYPKNKNVVKTNDECCCSRK